MRGQIKERLIRVSTKPHHKDDFSFTIGGIKYFMDKAVGEEKDFLTAQALRELNAEREKNAALEKKIYKLAIKAAKYEGYYKGFKAQTV